MACNCVTNKQLNELYKTFGHRLEPSNGEKTKFTFKKFFTELGVFLCLIPATIFMVFYIIYKYIFNEGKINIFEFFGLNNEISNARLKQILSNQN